MSPELQQKMAMWRQKAVAGELSLEEMKEAVKLMREGRATAVTKSDTAKRAAAKAAIPNAADLLKELGL